VLLILDIVAIAAGLAIGFVVGYWIGSRYRGQRGILWSLAGGAIATAWVIDLAGFVSGQQWLATGSIGLMAGLITGIKYGGFPEVRVWDKPPPGARVADRSDLREESVADGSVPEGSAPEEEPRHDDAPSSFKRVSIGERRR
jgi:hypothetical protein